MDGDTTHKGAWIDRGMDHEECVHRYVPARVVLAKGREELLVSTVDSLMYHYPRNLCCHCTENMHSLFFDSKLVVAEVNEIKMRTQHSSPDTSR